MHLLYSPFMSIWSRSFHFHLMWESYLTHVGVFFVWEVLGEHSRTIGSYLDYRVEHLSLINRFGKTFAPISKKYQVNYGPWLQVQRKGRITRRFQSHYVSIWFHIICQFCIADILILRSIILKKHKYFEYSSIIYITSFFVYIMM
jgi:hypothetical protein